ncbi:MAG: hypothetical protein EOO77_09670 [Oxalobacteraceae bacterium]|nr:MAG: hypothetical protein EOO77_09670 [Oxalobacteraceae bacterium]
MTDKLKRTLLGAAIAIALAAAVSSGLVSQQTADGLQNKANEAIAEDQARSLPTNQQPAPTSPTSQEPGTPERQSTDMGSTLPAPAPATRP